MGLFSKSEKYAWVFMNNTQSAWTAVGWVSVNSNPTPAGTAPDNAKIASAINEAFQLFAKKYPDKTNDVNNSNCLLFGSFEKNDFNVLCPLIRREKIWGIVDLNEFPLKKIANLKIMK